MTPAIEAALGALPAVDPALLGRRELLRRTDTKFLLPAAHLAPLLETLSSGYGALAAGTTRVASYRTLYYDTPSLACYHDHQRGRRPRHKVRVRHYPDRQVSWLEVKTKTNRDLTVKERHPRAFGDSGLSPADMRAALERTGLDAPCLVPVAWTCFRRITLVGARTEERITIDLDLHLEHAGLARRLENVLVVEIKQPRFDARSPGMLALRACGARRARMSKYATTIALLAPGQRRNRLLPTLRHLGRVETWQTC